MGIWFLLLPLSKIKAFFETFSSLRLPNICLCIFRLCLLRCATQSVLIRGEKRFEGSTPVLFVCIFVFSVKFSVQLWARGVVHLINRIHYIRSTVIWYASNSFLVDFSSIFFPSFLCFAFLKHKTQLTSRFIVTKTLTIVCYNFRN